jgi:hypothetical protein
VRVYALGVGEIAQASASTPLRPFAPIKRTAPAGRMDEARSALAEARRLNPAITIKWLKEHTPNLPASFDGLRKAGLPEE